MKIKFTCCILLFFCLIQLLGCGGKRYGYLGSINVDLYENWVDSNRNNHFQMILDSNESIAYQKLMIMVDLQYIIAANSNHLINNSYAFQKERIPAIIENNYTNIRFLLMADYNEKYKLGAEIFDLLDFGTVTTREDLIQILNSKEEIEIGATIDALSMRLKEPPSDTVELAIQVILEDDNGNYFHNINRPIKVF